MSSTNRILLQTFEWHTRDTRKHYVHLTKLLPQFTELGITSIWLPPGCKANNPQGNGYDIYDLWDLGEFDQKGSTSTKWGTISELDRLIRTAKECGVDVIWDAVINHKQAGDRTEKGIWAVEVDKEDRRYEISAPKQIEAWLRYDFPGREKEGMKYSKMKWRAEHFNGTDWDQSRERHALYKLIDEPTTRPPFKQPIRLIPKPIVSPRSKFPALKRPMSSQAARQMTRSTAPPARRPGKGWADDVDSEHGNNDYLLFSNIDYTHPEVREEVSRWGEWMLSEVGVRGFRLDAVQHFSYNFTRDWIQRMNAASMRKDGEAVFVAGEVWTGDLERLLKWLDVVQQPNGPQVYAYDSPLLYNFSRISEDVRTRSRNTDLRTTLRNSLLQRRPEAAITLVTNHDTQPGQTCYTPMDSKLKALFYAFILLRQEGYPCIFWGDLFGTHGPHAENPACLVPDVRASGGRRSLLFDMILCRKLFAYGVQKDYWDGPTCIGWTRAGQYGKPGCAILLNISSREAVKSMQIGQPGEKWIDVLGQIRDEVKIDEKGYGFFSAKSCGIAVFVKSYAVGAEQFPGDWSSLQKVLSDAGTFQT